MVEVENPIPYTRYHNLNQHKNMNIIFIPIMRSILQDKTPKFTLYTLAPGVEDLIKEHFLSTPNMSNNQTLPENVHRLIASYMEPPRKIAAFIRGTKKVSRHAFYDPDVVSYIQQYAVYKRNQLRKPLLGAPANRRNNRNTRRNNRNTRRNNRNTRK